MSDIGILNGFWDMVFIVALLSSPGVAMGGIAGAMLWRGHRVAGLLLGALVGGALCFAGWAWFN